MTKEDMTADLIQLGKLLGSDAVTVGELRSTAAKLGLKVNVTVIPTGEANIPVASQPVVVDGYRLNHNDRSKLEVRVVGRIKPVVINISEDDAEQLFGANPPVGVPLWLQKTVTNKVVSEGL